MKKNKTLVIGCGRLGSSIATHLSTIGKNVIMIDKDLTAFKKLADAFNGYTIDGDATDVEFLSKAFIDEANTVIIVTDDDNVNIFVSHICYHIFKVPSIYIRLADNNKAELIKDTNIKAIYPFLLSYNEFLSLYAFDLDRGDE